VPYGYLAVQVEALLTKLNSLVGSYQAMGVAEFNALREQRIRDSDVSGFANWGKHTLSGIDYLPINEGLSTDTTTSNNLRLGKNLGGGNAGGISRTYSAISVVNGVQSTLGSIAAHSQSVIKFPTAPDGTKTYDSATGLVVTHSSSTIAFASETETNKVITSRQDYAFLESWHEKISDKDVVYPLGNVQYGASTWKGIALTNTLVAQGYSAFGEWDTSTTGYGALWGNLTPDQQAIFLQDSDNNIYSDNGELIQVRYRVRVIEGLGDDWQRVLPWVSNELEYEDGSSKVAPRGHRVNINDFTSGTSWGYAGESSSFTNPSYFGKGHFVAQKGTEEYYAHNGLCFAIPIDLVQRRNQGAYHPSFNTNGCAQLGEVNNLVTRRSWYDSLASSPSNVAECFTLATLNGNGKGNIGKTSGRPDEKFYDAIYASDVQDLRMSSRRVPVAEIREKYKRMAIAGEVRGYEGVPFSTVYSGVGSGSSANASLNWLLTGGAVPVFYVYISNTKAEVGDIGYLYDETIGLIVRFRVGEVFNTQWVRSDLGTTENLSAYEVLLGTPPVGNDDGTGSTAYLIIEKKQAHSQANPTWTDIIGDPANIAATFPNGVEGQWIKNIPFNGNTYHFNRKVVPSLVRRLQTLNEVDFTYQYVAVNNTDNSFTSSAPTGTVSLFHYETPAHFTEDVVNITQLTDWSPVYATNNHKDAILTSSLIGKIATGSDPSEELSITKIISDVVSHTPETLTPVVKYSTAIGVKEGVAYLLFNCDDSGVIDGSNIKSTALPYFINEA
jgi:hypothetical protein